jgi:hypothetical protein
VWKTRGINDPNQSRLFFSSSSHRGRPLPAFFLTCCCGGSVVSRTMASASVGCRLRQQLAAKEEEYAANWVRTWDPNGGGDSRPHGYGQLGLLQQPGHVSPSDLCPSCVHASVERK